MPLKKAASLFPLLAVLLFLVACEESVEAPGTGAADVEEVEGSGQSAEVATKLPVAVAVRVIDKSGFPVRGVPVSWSVPSGSGTITVLDSVTDRAGASRAEWVLGTKAGTHTAIASVEGLAPVTFSARGTPGAPATITLARDSMGTRNLGDTTRIVATVSDRFGNPVTDQSITYESSNQAIATVNQSGLVTTQGRGATTIVLTRGSARATFRVRVTEIARVRITPAPITFTFLNETRQLIARAEDAQGVPFGDLPTTWSSGNNAIVDVSSSGIARAVAGGSAPVIARIEGVQATATAEVNQIVTGLTISPASPSVSVGNTLQLIAVARDAGGSAVPNQLASWASTSPNISVTSSGLVTGVARGSGTVTARIGTATGSAELVVTATMIAIAGGEAHTCAIGAVSTSRPAAAMCWGSNDRGQLGTGTQNDATTPENVLSGLQFTRIASGSAHACGLTTSGSVACWGQGTFGQLGAGDFASSIVPVLTGLVGGMALVTAGENHTCALSTGNAAFCWGSNEFGKLGTGTTTNTCVGAPCTATPTDVSGGLSFRWITAGTRHTCAVQTPSGNVYCWGLNSSGQLGTGTNTASTVPVQVTGGLTFTEVSAGDDFTCGVTGDLRAYCWGRNSSGQLGNGNTVSTNTPVAVSGGLTFAQVVAGRTHACGRTTLGQIYCWGANGSGQLGDGTTNNSSVPVQVALTDVTFSNIGSGHFHSCGITMERVAYCWGQNSSGQLGDGTTTNRLVPTRVR